MAEEFSNATLVAAEEVAPRKRGLGPEAVKIPDRWGWLHDRGVGGTIGFLVSVMALKWFAPNAGTVQTGAVFAAGGAFGVALGKHIPARYRELLQTFLILVGVVFCWSFLSGCAVRCDSLLAPEQFRECLVSGPIADSPLGQADTTGATP